MDLKPISLKVPLDVLARIDAAAVERGTTRTALLLAPWLDDEPTFEQALTAEIATRLAPGYVAPAPEAAAKVADAFATMKGRLDARRAEIWLDSSGQPLPPRKPYQKGSKK